MILFVLVTFALFTIFDIKLKDISLSKKHTFKVKKINVKRLKIEKIVPKKPNYFEKRKLEAVEVLKQGNFKMNYNGYIRLVLICSAVGIVIGLLFNNVLLSGILALGFTYIPVQYLKFKQIGYIKALNSQLESTLDKITSTYIKCEDIERAVRDNLSRIEDPMLGIFKEFLVEISFIDSKDIVGAIRKMRNKVNNQFFKDWCSDLIMCQDDRDLKYSLKTHIDKITTFKKMQTIFDSAIFSKTKEFLTVVVIIAMVPLIYKFTNKMWFSFYTEVIYGKIIISITSSILLWAVSGVIKINKPLSN